MNFPCPIAIHCPDNPFANLSSEGVEVWTAVGYCCDSSLRQGFSALSQGDAFLATAQLMRDTCPDCRGLPQEFCAEANCPDGSNLTEICVPTSQANADELAAAAAAAMLPFCDNKDQLFEATCTCPDGVTDPHTTRSNISQEIADAECEVIPKTCPQLVQLSGLPPFACLGNSFSSVITLTGSTGLTWSVSSGTLPPGITFTQLSDTTASLSGTPTTSGSYTFTIHVQLSGGNSIERTYTLIVFGFVTTSALPNGEIGIGYLEQIVVQGGSGNYLFTITDGHLPNGLLLSSTGLITGTPITLGAALFTITVQDLATPAVQCSMLFSMEILAPSGCGPLKVFAYYQCEASPDNDLVDGHPLTALATPATIAAGIIGNAFECSNFFGWTMQNVPGPGTTDWDFSSTEFSIRIWFYLPNTNPIVASTLCGTDNWGFTYACAAGTSSYLFRVREPLTAVFRTVTVTAPAATGWHYVLGWFKPGSGIGIHLDTVASVFNATVPAMKSDTGLFFAVYNLFAQPIPWKIDEIAIWKCVPSEAQIVIDYNGGAGKTYPNIIGA